jgi:hypothetical protein
MPPESAHRFQDAHDDIQKPSLNETVNEDTGDPDTDHECDDFPSSEHRFLATHPQCSDPTARWARFPWRRARRREASSRLEMPPPVCRGRYRATLVPPKNWPSCQEASELRVYSNPFRHHSAILLAG